jgi:hypothetical protein
MADLEPHFPELPRHWGRVFANAERPGRSGRSELAYAQVAVAYLDKLHRDPPSAAPVQELANDLCLSPSHVRNLLYNARKRGLLTASEAGKAGGDLTDRARALLENSDEGEH